MQVSEFTWSTKFKIFNTNNIYSVEFSVLHLMMDCWQGIMKMGVLIMWRWWIMLTCYCGPWIIHHPQRCMWYWPCRMVYSSMWYINYIPKAMTSWWLIFFIRISNLIYKFTTFVTELGSITEGRPGSARHSRISIDWARPGTLGFPLNGLVVRMSSRVRHKRLTGLGSTPPRLWQSSA